MQTRVAVVSVALILTIILPVLAGSVAASPPAQDAGATAVSLAAVASRISYQGRLTDAGGNPLSGNYNLVFQLWDDATAGGQVGSDIVMNSVPVNNGTFTVELEVNAAEFTGQALWLRIQVNGQWLSPRQELLPVPYALSLRPGAGVFGDVGFAGALNVGNMGSGPGLLATSGPVMFDAPESQFGVFAAGHDGGVFGFTNGPDKFGGAFTGDGGVSGSGQSGPGGSFTSIDGPGLAAYSESNPAVEATSSEDVAVYATTGTIPLILIQGKQAVVAYGEDNGVIAWGGWAGGSFTGTTGVLGHSDADGNAGVHGTASGLDGMGIQGEADFGTGVLGTGETGVKGTSSVGAGVRGDGSVGVEGHGQSAEGVMGISQTTRGVTGEGPLGGVMGTSTSGDGVEGHSQSGSGVFGVSTSGDGVVGNSQSGVAVYGNTGSGTAAVMGEGPKGVYGKSSAESGEGVTGEGLGQLTEGVLGSSAYAHGVGGYSNGTNGGLAIGVYGQTNATWGLATNQNLLVGGSCTGCTVVFIGQNRGAEPLQVGDVVAISGIVPPLKGQQTPVLRVQRAAAAGEGLLGVVQARATVEEVPASLGDANRAETIQMPGIGPGAVTPGEYLFVVVQGLVQVRADASASAIQVGDPVGPVAEAGLARKVSPGATSGAVLGRALEPLDEGSDLIWALLLGR